MRIARRRGWIAAAVILVVALLLGLATLVPWSTKLENTYQRMLFQEVADRVTQGASDPQAAAALLLNFVHSRVIGPPALRPIGDVEPAILLSSGRGWCDQSANVLTQLARTHPMDSRLIFLLDANGSSPHSVAELFVNGRWCVMDTTLGIPLYNRAGQLASREDLLSDPAIFDQASSISSQDRLASLELYRQEPVVFNTWRGKRVHWMDRLSGPSHQAVLYAFQELYLAFSRSITLLPEADRLLQKAQQYAFTQRFKPAEKIFQKLIQEPNELAVRQEARMGLARLYQSMQRPADAFAVLQAGLMEDTDESRIAAIRILRGSIYEHFGEPSAALEEYCRGTVLKDAVVLERIKQIASKLQARSQ